MMKFKLSLLSFVLLSPVLVLAESLTVYHSDSANDLSPVSETDKPSSSELKSSQPHAEISAAKKDESQKSETVLDIEPKTETESLFNLLDAPQLYLSSGINGLTTGIDEFFSDEKILYESTGSYVRISGDAVLTNGGAPGFVGDVKARFLLPNTQKKMKLVFESDPSEGREDLERQLEGDPLAAAQEKTYFAGLEAVWGEFKNWQVRQGIGVRLRTQLDFFVRVRADRLYKISKTWRAYLSETLYWFDSTGVGFDANLEFDHRLHDTLLFRSNTFAGWAEEDDYWNQSQVFSLTQSLSEKRAMIYQAGVYGITEPEIHSVNYLLQMRYRQRIHSHYLFMELIPSVLYARTSDFEPAHSFTVRLEMVFN